MSDQQKSGSVNLGGIKRAASGGLLKKNRTGIMVAGCPRSGSTILAKVLALSPEVGYIEEPFNSQTGMLGTDDRFFPYIDETSSFYDAYRQILDDILDGRANYKENQLQPETNNPLRIVYRHIFTNRYQIRYKLDTYDPRVKRYVLKDPTATLLTEYFMENPRLRVIYTLRHPCGVVASHQRLGWTGTPIHDFLSRPALFRLLSPDTQAVQGRTLSEVEGLAWYWRAVNEIVLRSAVAHPDMPIVSHESFSRDPISVVRRLFALHNIPFSAKVEQKLVQLTGADNPVDPTNNDIHVLKRNSRANIDRWQKLLSKQDQATIQEICEPVYQKIKLLPNYV
ncbi:sulfotransferase [Candidatus Saccharibacteria bacterium]|nr:sulfotransferase [Candidatus Saccharibacteria bacterium]